MLNLNLNVGLIFLKFQKKSLFVVIFHVESSDFWWGLPIVQEKGYVVDK